MESVLMNTQSSKFLPIVMFTSNSFVSAAAPTFGFRGSANRHAVTEAKNRVSRAHRASLAGVHQRTDQDLIKIW